MKAEKNKPTGMNYIYRSEGSPVNISELQKELSSAVSYTYKRCRKDQRISQIELAKMTGIPQPNITRFESGESNPTLEMMVKMAAALGKRLTINLEDLEDKLI